MHDPVPELPLFRSRVQAALLVQLLLPDTGEWRSLSALARAIGSSPSSVQREVDRLSRAGLVVEERVGNTRRVRADRHSRFYPELSGLILKAAGPVAVIGSVLRDVPGIVSAHVFGSWARHLLRPETMVEPARDIDLLVVGTPPLDALYRACGEAGARVGLDVNPTVVSEDEVAVATAPEADGSVFLREVWEGDRVEIPLGTTG